MTLTPVRPLGHRLVIQPDTAPTQTEGGILLPETAAGLPPMSGTVIRRGDGSARDARLRAKVIARCAAILADAMVETATPGEALVMAQEEIARYLRDVTEVEPLCEVGQRVIFPMEAGHEIVLGEDAEAAVVILDEDSVLAVYDAEPQDKEVAA